MQIVPTPPSKVEVFSFQRAKSLQKYCGDAYFFCGTEKFFFCVLVDGLGSGIEAHRSAQTIIDTIRETENKDLRFLMEKSNQIVTYLRGAAITMMSADLTKKQIAYSGVGNIRFYMISDLGQITYPLPKSGYLSGRKQKFIVKTFSFSPGTKFLIHTDGLELTHVRKYLESKRNVIKTGQFIEHTIPEVPADDVTFLLGEFPGRPSVSKKV